MNQLELGFQGGDPLTLDDLEFLRDGLSEALQGLASIWQPIGSDPIILSGISGTVSGLDTIWTSGFIIVNREVYYVAGTTTVSVGTCIDISETIDTNGDETFEDLATHSTYKIRRGVLKNSVGGPNEIDIVDFRSLKDRLSSMGAVVDNSTAWINVGSGGTAPAFSTTWDNVSSGTFNGSVLRFRKTKTGEIALDGSCIIPVSGFVHLIFTLPVGFRPLTAKRFSVVGNNNSINACWDLIITSNGDVSIYNMSAYDNTASLQLALDNVRFFTD